MSRNSPVFRTAAAVAAAFVFNSSVLAQTIQEVLWNVPSGRAADLSQTFRIGNTIPVSWNAYNGTIDDLWVTTWDYHIVAYEQLLKEGIDLRQAGSYSWTIDIPEDQLVKSAKYSLRFKPPNNGVYDVNDTELSSPGFLVIAAAQSSASTTSTTSSATSSPATDPTNGSETNTAASSSQTTNESNGLGEEPATGLSSGAKAGIGVGVAAGVIALVGVAFWFWRKGRGKGTKHELEATTEAAQGFIPPPSTTSPGIYSTSGYSTTPYSEIAGKPVHTPAELGDTSPAELYAGHPR